MAGSCASNAQRKSDTQTIQVRKTNYRGTVHAPTLGALSAPYKVDITVSEKVETEAIEATQEKSTATIAPEAVTQIASAVVAALPIPLGSLAAIPTSNASEDSLLYAALTGLGGALAGGSAVHLSTRRKRLDPRKKNDTVSGSES
jgi:hypothetical protein